ncbi:MAG: isoprenylcysteine carboxylmethyltransferase family protein [Pseudomonadota bacterium]
MTGPLIPPPVQAAATGAASWFIAGRAPFAAIDTPITKLLGLGFAAAGFLIGAVAVGAFFQAKTTVNPHAIDRASTLVTGGLYRYSRNPMYLALLLVLIGWAAHLSNLAAFAPIPLFVWMITVLQIKPEEAALRERFGAEYDAYCNRAPRWI